MPKRRAIKRENGQGSVYKRSDIKSRPWVAVAPAVRDGSNMRYRKMVIGTFATAQEAKDALDQFRRSPTDKYNLTVEQIHEEWVATAYRDISKQTKDNYNAAWLKLSPIYERRFRDLRTADMQVIVDELAETMSKSTVQKVRVVLTSMYKYAIQNDIVTKNYAEYLTMPSIDKAEKPDNVFSETDVQRLRLAADAGDDMAGAIMIMIYTGFRISEFLALTPFSWDAGSCTLKGGNKTRAGKNRTVPVHSSVVPYLLRWLDKGGSAIICKEDGSKFRQEYFRSLFYEELDKLGIRRVTPHATRHTCSTMLAAAGVRPEILTAIIGHEDYSTDVNTYLHPSVDTLSKAVNSMV